MLNYVFKIWIQTCVRRYIIETLNLFYKNKYKYGLDYSQLVIRGLDLGLAMIKIFKIMIILFF